MSDSWGAAGTQAPRDPIEGKHKHEPKGKLDKQNNWKQSSAHKFDESLNSISDCSVYRIASGLVLVLIPLLNSSQICI